MMMHLLCPGIPGKTLQLGIMDGHQKARMMLEGRAFSRSRWEFLPVQGKQRGFLVWEWTPASEIMIVLAGHACWWFTSSMVWKALSKVSFPEMGRQPGSNTWWRVPPHRFCLAKHDALSPSTCFSLRSICPRLTLKQTNQARVEPEGRLVAGCPATPFEYSPAPL